jgi:hypothetical protein
MLRKTLIPPIPESKTPMGARFISFASLKKAAIANQGEAAFE